MSYTWKALYPKDESSTTVVVYDDSGKQRINLTLTKDEFCGLHIPARSERTLNSIMVKELAREKREIEEAKKKADERSALRQSEIASAKATWPDKEIVSHKVRVYMHEDGKMCAKVRCHKPPPHIGKEVNVWAPSNATTEELQNIAVKRHNETVPSDVPKEFAAAVSSAANRRTQSDSSSSDSDGGSRGGYRSRRRSRRRGRKLRKQTRKH